MSRPGRVDRLPVAIAVCAALLAVLGAGSYTVYKTRIGEWTALWHRQAVTEIAHSAGHAYVARIGRPDLSAHDRPSPALMLENGQVFGRANSRLADVRDLGEGRFTVWHDEIQFSTSDNSDPRTNGRHYAVWIPAVARPVARALYAVTAAHAILTLTLVAWLTRRVGLSGVAAAAASAAAAVIARASRMGESLLRRRGRRAALAVLAAAWTTLVLLLAVSEAVYLTRTAQWTGWWREAPVGAIRHEAGFGYIAHTGRPEIGSHDAPAPTALLEDGIQVGLRNAPHAEIREVGRGRYLFSYDQVYFSSSDNSDPRTNGRRYTMSFPPISRSQARLLYAVTGVALILTLLVTVQALRFGVLGAALARSSDRLLVALLVAASAASLVVIAALRASPVLAPLVPDLWFPVVVLNVAGAWVVRTRYGPRVPLLIASSYLAALVVSFGVLSVWAPQRPQGCHTSEPYPAWDMFCTAPDSASYYFPYVPGSTRHPLYPWLIEALTAGSDFQAESYLARHQPGRPHTDPRDPLLRVVRAQIVLMLAAAAVLCLALMRVLGTPLPAVAMLWMHDHQFFTGEELNIVLTEATVQGFQLLLVAGFCTFLWSKRRDALVLASVACGAAYLTRQAAGYSAMLLGIMWVVALWGDWRRWWRWCLTSLAVFAAFVAVVPIHSYVTTGRIGGQDHLQYQYRIAHALQYATLADTALMPDQESREWLADAVRRRDAAHEQVRVTHGDDEYNRMVYSIAANLYEVATPITGYDAARYTPAFFMKVATPILVEHWTEYLAFSFRFWQLAMSRPGLARLGIYGFSPWLTFLALGALALWLRDIRALMAVSLILAHWGAVAITCLFAVPIPRMVFASDNLVVIAGLILVCGSIERMSGSPAGEALRGWLTSALGRGNRDAGPAAGVWKE